MDRENPVLKAFIIDEEKNVTIEEIKITEQTERKRLYNMQPLFDYWYRES